MTALAEGTSRPLDVALRRVSLAVLLTTAALVGVRSALVPARPDLGFATPLAGLLCCLAVATWCEADGRLRGRRPLRTNLEGVFYFLPVGLAVYCLWSRGFRGWLPLSGLLLAGLLALSLGAVAGNVVAMLAGR